ncbi:MAG TPA: 3-hydroxybutyryl-CoA dehydrogenase, partial [Thermoplasmata archaeon]|nr:3-hydroxybutyryl-CoA dehydrogenase [Thermoplasmata archaeon]
MRAEKIGVVGAGQMGHGIALVSAKAGFNVVLRDVKDEYVEKGLSRIEKFLDKSIEKGKLTVEEKEN